MTITKEMYLAFVRDSIREEGITVADTANKLALEIGAISTSLYRQAARIIVEAFIDR